MVNRSLLLKIYTTLVNHFGHRNWWPGDTRFEVILGAILTQNTSWKNVEKALANLKNEKALSYKAIKEMPLDQLAALIRPSGYFNQKSLKIKAFIAFVEEHYNGSLKKMFDSETAALRKKLLGVKGIGPETADSILLYAGEHLTFVIDLYTKRVMTRHGWANEDVDYHALQQIFENNLPKDVGLYNDYHAQLVAVGNHFCRATPKCDGCPLKPLLPA